MREYTFDVTESAVRKDNRLSLSLYLGYRLSRSWTSFWQSSFMNNDSNFDQNTSSDRNYEQISSSLGLSYRF
ncbi:MAG: hypothetical protein HRT44_01940 [Bdellovibrionales bacterium]|nr:hypothetical protein [Bdellovibrionales bacterium]